MFSGPASCAFELTCVERIEEAEKYLAGHSVDLALLDVAESNPQRLEAVRLARTVTPRVAVVLLTSPDDEPIADQANQEGVHGYLVKGQIDPQILMRTLGNAVGCKIFEQMLCNEEQRARIEFDCASDALVSADRGGNITFLNPAGERMTGWPLNEAAGRLLTSVFRIVDPGSRKAIPDPMPSAAWQDQTENLPSSVVLIHRDGGEFFIEEFVAPIDEGNGQVTGTAIVFREVGAAKRGNLELIKSADNAVHHVRKDGRQRHRCCEPEINLGAVTKQSIEQGLEHALERNELALHYQPKINLRTGAISGAEALSRWMHPTEGSVSPRQFLPIAEESGMILPIDRWALREACAQATAWVHAGMPATSVAVNVSEAQFQTEDFPRGLFAILASTHLDPRSLELDVSESALMKYPERTIIILKVLREVGVRVSVDNFGMGNSTIGSLRKLPLHALKIDRSFVRQITTDPGGKAVVAGIIGMGRQLNLRVIAAGVETSDDLEFLWAQDCDEAQGNFISQPLPPEQLTSLLARAS